MTLPTLPHAILAHLQGTQNQHTKANLAKELKCQPTANTPKLTNFYLALS